MEITKLENVDFDKLTIIETDSILGFDKHDGSLKFMFDELKNTTTSGEQEVVYANGRQGVALAAIKKNKTAKITAENGYVVASAYAAQIGSKIETASENNKFEVQRYEYITAKAEGSIELAAEAKVTDLKYVYSLNSDRTKKDTIDVTAAVAEGKTTITAKTSGDIKANEEYLVIYTEEVATAKRIVNRGDTFSDTVKLVVNYICEDPCTNVKFIKQVTFGSADISGNFEFAVGDNPAVHNFEATAMRDVCSATSELFTEVIA